MPKKTTHEDHCSFCGRPASQVEMLLSGLNGYICNDCITQASLILKEQGIGNKTDLRTRTKAAYQQSNNKYISFHKYNSC